ncbi:hypothetical protein CDAR_99171 [Caerostris darwini]|uniref:Uncharacterized protein n=1 Tax=Caerostris darwini TaxID=1538125 RepID=A0AAV4Q008_9ARAC|nr:hypothetical protein CDAR_99171 [Caerostris darwini]
MPSLKIPDRICSTENQSPFLQHSAVLPPFFLRTVEESTDKNRIFGVMERSSPEEEEKKDRGGIILLFVLEVFKNAASLLSNSRCSQNSGMLLGESQQSAKKFLENLDA